MAINNNEIDLFDNKNIGYNTQGPYNGNQMQYDNVNYNQSHYSQPNQEDYIDNYEAQQNFIDNNYQQQEEKENIFAKLLDSGFKFNLGNKSFSIIIFIVGLIVIAIIGSIITRPVKPKQQTVTKTVVQQQVTTQKQNTKPTNIDTKSLTIVENNISIDYSATILETSGLVTTKNKYLLNGQLVYSLGISIPVGNEQKEIEHFCNYSTYKSINTGDVLGIKYQQVSESVISITDVTKQ